MLNGGGVYVVVLGMSTYKLDEEERSSEIGRNDQTMLVSSDVEHDAVRVDDAGMAIGLLHGGGIPPFGLCSDIVPRCQRRG